MSLGILCPGQGDQHRGMLDLVKGEAAAGPVMAEASRLLGVDPWALLSDPAADLHRNAVAQPLICAAQAAVWAVLRRDLPPVRAIAGYSLGELSAYGCAGALDPADLLDLAAARAEAMDRAGQEPGGLLAVRGLDRAQVEALCRAHGLEVAIVNDADRLVVGGRRERLATFSAAAEALNAGVTPLAVAVASHTALMEPAAARFAGLLAESRLADPLVPVLAGIDGAPVRDRVRAIATLSRQIATTVEWAACLDGLVERGCTVLLELGPGNALSRMARDRHPSLVARSVADFRTLGGVAAWVGRQLG